jgi:hypothetical protein
MESSREIRQETHQKLYCIKEVLRANRFLRASARLNRAEGTKARDKPLRYGVSGPINFIVTSGETGLKIGDNRCPGLNGGRSASADIYLRS